MDQERQELCPAAPPDQAYPLTLLVGHGMVWMQDAGQGFYRLDPRVADRAYLYDSQLQHRGGGVFALVQGIENLIDRFPSGQLTRLYRGINRHHPLWHSVRGTGVIQPLGNGDLPGTSTRNTRFVPFSPDMPTGRQFALAPRSGFSPKDDIRFVRGYDPEDETFPYGMLVRVDIDPSTPIGFINASEIQVEGPVRVTIEKTYTMEPSSPRSTPSYRRICSRSMRRWARSGHRPRRLRRRCRSTSSSTASSSPEKHRPSR